MNTVNKSQYGLCKLAYAIRDPTTLAYGTPKMEPGAISLAISRSNKNNGLAADNGTYDGGNSSKTVTGDLNMARFSNDWLIDLLGHIAESGGIGEGEGEAVEFALLGEVSGNLGGFRFVWYCCTAAEPTTTFQTIDIDGTITYATETAQITSKICELSNGLKRRAWKCEVGTDEYDTFFDAVVIPAGS